MKHYDKLDDEYPTIEKVSHITQRLKLGERGRMHKRRVKLRAKKIRYFRAIDRKARHKVERAHVELEDKAQKKHLLMMKKQKEAAARRFRNKIAVRLWLNKHRS